MISLWHMELYWYFLLLLIMTNVKIIHIIINNHKHKLIFNILNSLVRSLEPFIPLRLKLQKLLMRFFILIMQQIHSKEIKIILINLIRRIQQLIIFPFLLFLISIPSLLFILFNLFIKYFPNLFLFIR
jgi:hypothetical protein